MRLPINQTGTPFDRSEKCDLCGATKAELLAKLSYWDLQDCNLVYCLSCLHAQLDPMISEKSNQIGSHAYHLYEISHANSKDHFRNCLRSFRRGVVFALNLKKLGIIPNSALEIGPGNGFFLAGLKYVFSDLQITVLDVVNNVLESCKRRFGFSTLLGTPESLPQLTDKKFDLIIARDVIEHLTHVDIALKNISECLSPDGHFHFITPVGCTDYWTFYTAWKRKAQRSELLINHLNYFDGNSLKKYLEKISLKPVQFYGYGLKSFYKGRGWRKNYPALPPPATQRSASALILQEPELEKKSPASPHLSEILNLFPMKLKWKWLTHLYCRLKHLDLPKIPAEYNLGEEIYGIFRKTDSSINSL